MHVSIIITNYNYARFLAQAIDSALAQSYPAIDIIVVDDGSVDESPQIIESYGDRIVPIFKENAGQCAAFNAGFSRCKGDAVIFLDADDVLFPDAIEKHVEHMQDGEVAKSNGYLEVTNADLEPMGTRVPVVMQPSGDYLSRYLKVGPVAYRASFTSGNCWSRRVLERVLPLPEDPSMGGDAYLSSVDLLFGRIASIHEPVCWYRVHERNKGPRRYHFDVRYLKHRLEVFGRRIMFSAALARSLGYDVEPERWMNARNWKMTLAAHALKAMGEATDGPSLGELVISVFRPPRRFAVKNFVLAPTLALTGVLPKRYSLKIAAYLLGRTWGRQGSADVCSTNVRAKRIQH